VTKKDDLPSQRKVWMNLKHILLRDAGLLLGVVTTEFSLAGLGRT
jgi:hypothetical protein